MKKLLIALVAVVLPAVAQSPADAIYDRCAQLMAEGVCGALIDVDALTPEQLARTVPIIGPNGVVRVKYASFVNVRGLGSPDPNDLRMCQAARRYCMNDTSSEECAVARAYWGK